MLHILGVIVKIAGILLGSILGMVLVFLLAVLFVPVRYRVEGRYEETPFVQAKISWFLSALSVNIRYEEQKLTVKVKILGLLMKKKKKEKRLEQSVAAEIVREPAAEITDEPAVAKPSEEPEEKDGGAGKTMEREKTGKRKIEYTNPHICDKIKEIGRKKEAFQAFLRDEKNKRAFDLIRRELLHMWKQIRPKKMSVSCHFGFEDPSVTGQVLAAGAAFYPLYRDKIRLYPDFSQKVLMAEGNLRGRIRIFPLLLIIIRLWKNKQIRNIVEKAMK